MLLGSARLSRRFAFLAVEPGLGGTRQVTCDQCAANCCTNFNCSLGLGHGKGLGLHFYHTSCGVIQNQRRKIRRILSSKHGNKHFYFPHWRVI